MVGSRFIIAFLAVAVPFILLANGVYGSFIFTFSIPLLWQVGVRGRKLDSLGLQAHSIRSSLAVGVLSGCALGFSAAIVLRLAGVTDYLHASLQAGDVVITVLGMSFPLQNELGIRLLAQGETFSGAAVYLIFCLFAVGLGEEIFWRGFVQKKLSGYLSGFAAIGLAGLLFALAHLYIFALIPFKAGAFFLLGVAACGCVWGYLFQRFRTVWAAAVSHGITAFVVWRSVYFFMRQ